MKVFEMIPDFWSVLLLLPFCIGMFHLATNFGNLGNTANTAINALNDDVLLINNNQHVPAVPLNCLAEFGMGDELLRARDVTPSVAQLMNSYIPIHNEAQPAALEWPSWMQSFPKRRKRTEGIAYQVSNSAAGPTDTYIFQWLYESFTPAPIGQVYTMRGTSTVASVANVWTTLSSVTWEPSLPEGRYSVIGAAVVGTTEIAFSLIFPGQFYRPGGLAGLTEGNPTWERQRYGGLGEWGQFDLQTFPIPRVLNGGAVASHTIYLDVVRLG